MCWVTTWVYAAVFISLYTHFNSQQSNINSYQFNAFEYSYTNNILSVEHTFRQSASSMFGYI